MTELNDLDGPLPKVVEDFVLRWGDMGGEWGVNRSIAQIQALLYLSQKPLTAEEISDKLGIARSNVSNSLRELLGWKLVLRVPVLGDRRDHYVGEKDLWEMARRIAQGRKEREIDPVLASLRNLAGDAAADDKVDPEVRTRLLEMRDFVQTMDDWYNQMLEVPTAKIAALLKMGSRVVAFLGAGSGKRAARKS